MKSLNWVLVGILVIATGCNSSDVAQNTDQATDGAVLAK